MPTSELSLDGVERRLEIRDEVARVLEADREAHEPVADAERAPRLGGQARVRHDRRVLGERLDAAEALGAREDAERLAGTRVDAASAPFSSKLIIPPGPFICRSRERVPRVRRRAPGSARARPAGAPRATPRSPRALVDVLPHADAERLQPAQDQVAVERARHAADRLLEEVERSASASSLVITAPPTTSECPFRYFVVEWTTSVAPRASGRWSIGVANVLSTASGMPRRARDLGDGRDVEDLEHRVGRRLHPHEARVRAHRRARRAPGRSCRGTSPRAPNCFITLSKMRNVPP